VAAPYMFLERRAPHLCRGSPEIERRPKRIPAGAGVPVGAGLRRPRLARRLEMIDRLTPGGVLAPADERAGDTDDPA
jgi:hypothetical protein